MNEKIPVPQTPDPEAVESEGSKIEELVEEATKNIDELTTTLEVVDIEQLTIEQVEKIKDRTAFIKALLISAGMTTGVIATDMYFHPPAQPSEFITKPLILGAVMLPVLTLMNGGGQRLLENLEKFLNKFSGIVPKSGEQKK